ncbi:Na+/H+ antiporter NhaC family protein [Synergistaceae bacterium OttesenSCG-928-I11]|nr:Na+/H+ antiporter NhaC family protein [Synergistaceae bacterium OttesenSCG-928-I11]
MRNVFKLTPVVLIAGLMIYGIDILIAAPISFGYAIIVGMITERFKFKELLDAALENLTHFLIVFLILQLAYGVAESFMTTGVAASAINLALSLGVNASTVAVAGFLATCILSIATGTSWGTFAACAPIFLWLNHIIGGDVLLTIGAIAGGSCFGDNIGLISDTTVVSSGIQGVEIIKRVRHQGVWSLLCLIAASVVFYVMGSSMGLPNTAVSAADAIAMVPQEVWDVLQEERASAVTLLEQVQSGVPMLMILPLIIVLGLAIAGVTTLICLGSGIISALLFGLALGTVTSIPDFIDTVYTGFSDAGGWSIAMMLWVGAFGGVMNKMDAFRPIAEMIVRVSKNVRQLMTCNAMLCLFGNAALADEMAQIVTIGPILKDVTEKNVEASPEDMYTLALRNATFSDAMGVLGSQLVPWHVYLGFFIGISSSVYPLASDIITAGGIIKYNYLAWISVISMLVLTFTGWDRFIPLFKLPSEPQVRLKKAA